MRDWKSLGAELVVLTAESMAAPSVVMLAPSLVFDMVVLTADSWAGLINTKMIYKC